MGFGDRSNYCGAKGDGPFGRGRAETSRIARRTNKGKDKMNGDKGAAQKGLLVTQPIMSMRRKDEERDMKRSRDRKVTRLEEPKSSTILFKYSKVRSYRGFFPGKNCKPLACKRNYFIFSCVPLTVRAF